MWHGCLSLDEPTANLERRVLDRRPRLLLDGIDLSGQASSSDSFGMVPPAIGTAISCSRISFTSSLMRSPSLFSQS